jgi:TRAP-type C4-dicarboxylate transport system permease large subunit
MAGSSPATCSAIGSAGIPEMRKRGYSPGFAAGIIAAGGTLGILLPPSITMILYAVAAEVSLGPAVPCRHRARAAAGRAVRPVRDVPLPQGVRRGQGAYARDGTHSAYLEQTTYTLRQKVEMLPRVLPFVILLIGVMVALYGGYATPSETAGLGAVLALGLIAIVYHVWRPRDVQPILAATLKESTMLMFIIGMSLLFSYVMSYLHISQSAAEAIVGMHLSKWLLLAAILVMVVVLGFFLPPVSIILMTAPIVLPPLKAAGFDLIWFGVLMTIVMEMGLIHPPVGLNIFVIKNIAPDIPLRDVIYGVLPFVGLMIVAVVLICIFPAIATGFPEPRDGGPDEMNAPVVPSRIWNKRAQARERRLARVAARLGPTAARPDRPFRCRRRPARGGDRGRRSVCLEGNNQKQADFLALGLTRVDPARIHDLHMVQSVLGAARASRSVRARHCVASRFLVFRAAGGAACAACGRRQAQHRSDPHLPRALRAVLRRPDAKRGAGRAQAADRHGNLYTGPNTEDTPVIAEATAFASGIVIAQVNELVDSLPRIDIPADWVNFVVESPRPHYIEPLFTPRPGADFRDPGADGDDGDQGHLRRSTASIA